MPYTSNQVSGGVTERSRLLSQIADELEAVKAEMEERSSSMTDGAPLVNIRKTLTRMKQEVTLHLKHIPFDRHFINWPFIG